MKDINIVESMLIERKREKVAEAIQTARVQKGMTQEQLADAVGFSRNTILRIEGCQFSPNADQLYAILEVLELTLKINDEEI
jgi:transcriptional regulator with XRE-family HTH domain